MSTPLPVYDALASDAASMSPTLHQPDSQLSCDDVGSSTIPANSGRPNRTCVLRYWASWDWEFAACLLVLSTPIIMFATVYPHNGQPLPRWPFSISINSLLSVYTLVLKSSIGVILTSCIGQLQWTWYSEIHPLTDMLRFDNATRGAAGALGLIWRQRFRRPLTVLGCVIMVLAVIIDPFVQQLVQPIDCSVEVSGDTASASLPRTNWFDFYGLDLNASSVSPQKAVESAMYNAVFSAGQDPPWQCSTGNCTFHVNYATIGVCYSCQDRSADVILNRSCSEPDASYASQHPTSATDCPANSSFSVDSSFHGDSSYKPSTKTAIGPDRTQDFLAVLADTYSELECEAECEQGPNLPIGSRVLFEFLLGATAFSDGRIDWTYSDNSTCNSNEKEQSWACQGYGAATCSLYPCVKIYNATISAGQLEENLVASSSDTAWGRIYAPYLKFYALLDTQCSAQNQTSSVQNSSVESRWIPYDLKVDPNTDYDKNVDNLVASGCIYLISASSIMGGLSEYLNGMVQAVSISSATDVLNGWTKYYLSDFQGPEIIRHFYNWGHTDFEHVQSVIANISDSLTIYIRTHGGQSPNMPGLSRDALGKSYHYATCLQVRWPWISFPACLAALTTLFFLVVVEATGRQGTWVWKASPLAWILRADGLGNEQISSSSTKTCEGMEERSKQIAVHLFDEGPDGPRIRMADLKDPNLEVPH